MRLNNAQSRFVAFCVLPAISFMIGDGTTDPCTSVIDSIEEVCQYGGEVTLDEQQVVVLRLALKELWHDAEIAGVLRLIIGPPVKRKVRRLVRQIV